MFLVFIGKLRWRKLRKVYSVISLGIILLAIGATAACSIQKDDLTRIDAEVRIIKDNKQVDTKVFTTTNKKTIKKLDKLFAKVVWTQSPKFKMARSEDAIVTFFYQTDNNKPEELVEYHVWYNQKDDGATIISGSQEDKVGTLDKEFINKIKNDLSNEVSTNVVQKNK